MAKELYVHEYIPSGKKVGNNKIYSTIAFMKINTHSTNFHFMCILPY